MVFIKNEKIHVWLQQRMKEKFFIVGTIIKTIRIQWHEHEEKLTVFEFVTFALPFCAIN